MGRYGGKMKENFRYICVECGSTGLKKVSRRKEPSRAASKEDAIVCTSCNVRATEVYDKKTGSNITEGDYIETITGWL